MTTQAFHAVRAANNTHIWGRYAARQYCIKRGVPLRLYYLARTLKAAQHIYPN